MTAENITRSRTLKKAYYTLQRRLPKSRYGSMLIPILKRTGAIATAHKIMELNTRSKEKLVPAKKEVVDPSVRKELQTYYREDIRQLERLLDRDLTSFWK